MIGLAVLNKFTELGKALDWHTPLEKFVQLVDYHQAFKSVTPHV